MRAAKGEIVPPRPGASRGALGLEKHAFVIVGYTPRGFLVLNSWGPDWGGWPPDAPLGGGPVPGVALWRYDDWADTIMDGWVLRLGVGAAEAFEYSIGDQGLGFGAETAVRATPVHAILGNFLHLDDGEFVRSGAYVSTRRTLDETNRLLTEDAASAKPYRGVLLTFAGGLQGLREATDHVARWKRPVRDARLVSLHRALVRRLRRAGPRRARRRLPRGARRSRRPGRAAGPAGRGSGARRRPGALARHRLRRRPGGAAGGPLHDLARAGATLAAARPGFGLRIVAESEGAFALAALLRSMQTEAFAAEAGPFFEMLQSVDLVAPPLSAAEYAALAMYLNAGWGPGRPDRRSGCTCRPPATRSGWRCRPTSGSYFDLVAARLPAPRRGRRHRRPRADRAQPPEVADRHPVGRLGRRARTELVPIGWPAAQRQTRKARSASSSSSTGRTSAATSGPSWGRRTPPRRQGAAIT